METIYTDLSLLTWQGYMFYQKARFVASPFSFAIVVYNQQKWLHPSQTVLDLRWEKTTGMLNK